MKASLTTTLVNEIFVQPMIKGMPEDTRFWNEFPFDRDAIYVYYMSPSPETGSWGKWVTLDSLTKLEMSKWPQETGGFITALEQWLRRFRMQHFITLWYGPNWSGV